MVIASGLVMFVTYLIPSLAFGDRYETPAPRASEEALQPEFRGDSNGRIEEPVQHDGFMHTYIIQRILEATEQGQIEEPEEFETELRVRS